jgi:uncharacterized protein YuzE
MADGCDYTLVEGRAERQQNSFRQVEDIRMSDFKVFYDEEQDVLYFGKEGQEEESVELAPGVNVELDKSGQVIGLEVFNAASRFRQVIKPMEQTIEAA